MNIIEERTYEITSKLEKVIDLKMLHNLTFCPTGEGKSVTADRKTE